MSDKTPLERDIECHELIKTPIGIKILIALLVAGFCAVGIYALDLKKNLSGKEQEIALIKDVFQKERAELIEELKRLELDRDDSESR
jgi:hypothetical protein